MSTWFAQQQRDSENQTVNPLILLMTRCEALLGDMGTVLREKVHEMFEWRGCNSGMTLDHLVFSMFSHDTHLVFLVLS